MKILIACMLAVAMVLAEPPIDNRYLPPQQDHSRGGGFTPSRNYGPPNTGAGFGQKQTDAVFGSRPTSYDAPPSYNSNTRPSSQYGPPQSSQFPPSSQYGPPQPSSQYGLPSRVGPSTSQRGRPSSQYGPPGSNSASRRNGFSQPGPSGAPSFGAPSQQYGAPGFGGGQQGRSFGGAPSNAYSPPDQSRQYLPPGGSYDGNDGGNGEPANYNFEYTVKDEESGNDFGHRESRQGDRAEGLYYVVLPDGRKQTVEYEADENGYKPRISYEDTGAVGGYNRMNGQRGYSGSGPY